MNSMKHLLMHPGFPDLVGDCAFTELAEADALRPGANDNGDAPASELADPLFLVMARREIAATRLW
jgi:hypothetical protein